MSVQLVLNATRKVVQVRVRGWHITATWTRQEARP